VWAESSFESYIAPSTIARDLDVPIATVRRWIQRGDLPTVQIDRAVRVPRRERRQMMSGTVLLPDGRRVKWADMTEADKLARAEYVKKPVRARIEPTQQPEPVQIRVRVEGASMPDLGHADLKTRREKLAMVGRFLGEDDELFLQLLSLTEHLETAEQKWEAQYERCLRGKALGNT
jgi:hypothetical protein